MIFSARAFVPLLTAAVLASWSGPAAAVECNNFCNVELAKAVAGGGASAAAVRRQCGGPAKIGRPARDVFKVGGSRNIPVTCHAVLYLEEDTPGLRTWFEDYFAVQELAMDHGGAGFMGNEILSPLYGPLTAGPILAVLKASRQRRQWLLLERSERWLRAYWALSTLAAVQGDIRSHRAITRQGVLTGKGFSRSGGVVSAAAGARNGGALQGPATLIHPLLALALDVSPRSYTAGVIRSPGYYGGLRVAAVLAGYSLDARGRIRDFSTRTAPAASLGITSAQRDALRGFLGAGWREHWPTLRAMVGGFRPACELTFLRTTEGVMSWFGASSGPGTGNGEQKICNRNKGPYFAVRIDYNGTAHYLVPATEKRPAVGWKSFRQGRRICADNPKLTGGPWCLDLPGGPVQYEISWTEAEGLKLGSGSV